MILSLFYQTFSGDSQKILNLLWIGISNEELRVDAIVLSDVTQA